MSKIKSPIAKHSSEDKIVCKICKKPLLQNTGCKASTIIAKNHREYSPVIFGCERFNYSDYSFCPDCGTAVGQYHHRNCDIEECPVCFKPLKMCKCATTRFYEDDTELAL